MQNNALILFFREMFNRFIAPSPKYFKIWQTVAAVITAITGLPGFLQMFNIHLPASMTVLENKLLGIFTMGILFMSLMGTQNQTVAMSSTGELLKTTDDKKLPFTAKCEAKAEVKKEIITGTSLKIVDVKK